MTWDRDRMKAALFLKEAASEIEEWVSWAESNGKITKGEVNRQKKLARVWRDLANKLELREEPDNGKAEHGKTVSK